MTAQVAIGEFQRISVVGASGAGKSSLAVWMGQNLGLPVIHMDKEFFLPGWQKPALEAWKSKVKSLVSAPSWIMEGNYFDVMEARLVRTQAFVFLDVAREIRLLRSCARALFNLGRKRPDTGQLERFSLSHLRNAFYYMERRQGDFSSLEAACKQMPIPWVRLATATQLKRFKRDLLPPKTCKCIMIDSELAERHGVFTRHERMPNGELRFRLVGPDGTSYVRTESAEQGSWQKSHYHEQVRETYIVEKGWVVVAVLDEGSKALQLHLLKPGDVFTSPIASPHNLYLPGGAVIHTVKHSASSRDHDWHASDLMDRLTGGLSERELLGMIDEKD